MIDLSRLAAPFPPDRISWRVGSTTQDKKRGMALAYIDARDVMDRLDAVCGPEGWQCRYPHANGKTCCEIGIRCDVEWVWKANGAGDTDVEKEKGAFSDAFKRAAVLWGIGRYLYDLDSPWVELEAAGKSFKIADRELPRLRSLLARGQPAGSEPPHAAWVRKSIEQVNACASRDEIEAWQKKNQAALDRLADKAPEERDRLAALLRGRWQALGDSTILAGG